MYNTQLASVCICTVVLHYYIMLFIDTCVGVTGKTNVYFDYLNVHTTVLRYSLAYAFVQLYVINTAFHAKPYNDSVYRLP